MVDFAVNFRTGYQMPEPGFHDVIEPSDIRGGDLIFSTRRSLAEILCFSCDQPWRHVGIVFESSDGLAVVELAPSGPQQRSLDNFLVGYPYVGVARAAPPKGECVSSYLRRRPPLSEDVRVNLIAVLLSGAVAAARKLGWPLDSKLFSPVAWAAYRLARGNRLGTCANFAAGLLAKSNCFEDDTRLDTCSSESRSSLPTSMTDLVMPVDLWFAPAIEARLSVKLSVKPSTRVGLKGWLT